MAFVTKSYLDLEGLTTYDGKIKEWSNTANQIGIKTVLLTEDGNTVKFYKKPSATLSDTADFSIGLGGGDMSTKLNALGTFVGATYDAATHTWSFSGLDDDFDATTVVGALNELLEAIQAVAADIAAMNGSATIATQSGNIVTIKAGVAQSAGTIAQGSGTDIVLEEVAVTGAAEDVSVADAHSKLTATNVEDALEELVDAIATAVDASDVTCEQNSGSGDVLKVYSFYQGVLTTDTPEQKAAKKIVDVNIPKDYLVKSAEIKTVTTEDEPYEGAEVGDKYIDFTINTKDGQGTGTAEHIYIPINDLVSVIQGSVGAEVTVTVGSNNTIGASINTIDGSKITYIAESAAGAGDGETVKAALTRLDGAASVTGSVSQKINTAIIALDADVDASTDTSVTDQYKTPVISGVTEVDGILTAVDSIDVDIAGAATAAYNSIGSISTTSINNLFN